VRASVVERLHLDVTRVLAAVAVFEDDACVGELDVTVLLGRSWSIAQRAIRQVSDPAVPVGSP
jgi:hypothetical protein